MKGRKISIDPLRDLERRSTRITNLIRKELDFMSREKLSILVLLLLPVFIISVTGLAGFPDLAEPDSLWIIDEDNTDLSLQLINVLRAESNFTVISTHEDSSISVEKGLNLLPTEGLSAIIFIPEGFESQLESNGTTRIDIYIDAYEMLDRLAVQASIQLALVNFQLDYGNFESEVFYFPIFEPEITDDILKLGAPSIVAMSLFASLNLLSSQSIVGDMPLKRILTTPAYRFEVIIAKTISYGAIAFIETLISLFLWEFVFGGAQYTKGIFIDLFLVCFFAALGGVTIGILFSVISSTRLQAAQLFLFYFIIGMVLFMNIRIPLLLTFIPFEQSSKAITTIAYRGLGLSSIIPQIFNSLLTIFGTFLLSIILFMRKKELV